MATRLWVTILGVVIFWCIVRPLAAFVVWLVIMRPQEAELKRKGIKCQKTQS